ncbi:hypothetical protein PIB30_032157 [Stylosanthes scabra]|uniref:Uncharacterized protein n=1 Tax=Stylosanthes scabra TaxID=79078 RepID=A0ABU6YCC6_9FABA|nr:hypothetical protein [Stylosanthes scabra]
MADHSDSAAHKSRSDGAEENEEIIQFSNEDIKEGLDKCKRSLVGRLLADRKFSASTLESALYSIWRQPEEFKVIDHGDSVEVWHLASLATPLVDEIPWKWWLRISKILKQQSNGKQKLELAANLVLSIWKACNELIFENSHKSPAMIVEAAGFLALNNSSR